MGELRKKNRLTACEQLARFLKLTKVRMFTDKRDSETFFLRLTEYIVDEGTLERENDLQMRAVKYDFLQRITIIGSLVAAYLFSFLLVWQDAAGWIEVDPTILKIIGVSIIGETFTLILLLMKLVFGRVR